MQTFEVSCQRDIQRPLGYNSLGNATVALVMRFKDPIYVAVFSYMTSMVCAFTIQDCHESSLRALRDSISNTVSPASERDSYVLLHVSGSDASVVNALSRIHAS
jgi:hypothetical protein